MVGAHRVCPMDSVDAGYKRVPCIFGVCRAHAVYPYCRARAVCTVISVDTGHTRCAPLLIEQYNSVCAAEEPKASHLPHSPTIITFPHIHPHSQPCLPSFLPCCK